MTTQLEITDTEATALADLAARAPSTLRSSVLVEVGLMDRYGRIDESPLGPLVVAWNGVGVVSVDLAGDQEAFEARHLVATGRQAIAAEVPTRLANAIARRLDGDRRVRIPLDLRGHTGFEQDVWRKALEIPRGEVRPYGWIAAEIGRPKAVRAVGTALGHNPVPLIVPCHRVVRSDGFIGQYSLGGPHNKRAVLTEEGLDPDAMESAARRGERLVGCASTKIVCWPTCHTGRHMLERNRRPFRSLAEAGAAGYRPCKVCRPVAAAA
ncbi:MAG TPA: methylated-DNA--[protein]-cysteine S-methyltransferase [Patescibacteria group bacterium]|jgi:O-6-methylguanine DNA methyltransferase|nr:methylated-DNA--[protein]-cysteine S-methyltransferase [Patescibacteria group bacterium]